MDTWIVPKFHSRDILLGSTWKCWDGWVWYVHSYKSGWNEWVPAGQQLVKLIGMHCGGFHQGSMEQVFCEAFDCLQELHALFAPEVPPIDSGGELNLLLVTQLQYTAYRKSDWYYNSIPTNGYDSYLGCMWGKLLVRGANGTTATQLVLL